MIEEIGGELSRAGRVFRMVFGSGPGWVWKDPRLTVLLPFWERVTGLNPILVPCRDPRAVAHSISARDGLSGAQSLAVWERHTRSLTRVLRGRRVLVTDYDKLRLDAAGRRERLYRFCSEAAIAVTPATQSAEDILIRPKDTRDVVPNQWQQELADLVKSVEGSHLEFPDLNLPDPSPDLEERLNEIVLPSWLAARGAVSKLSDRAAVG